MLTREKIFLEQIKSNDCMRIDARKRMAVNKCSYCVLIRFNEGENIEHEHWKGLAEVRISV